MPKEHPILAVEQGRYDLGKVCPKCGGQFIKMQSTGDEINYSCGRCNHKWTNAGLDAFPVEKVGDLYLEFIDDLAEHVLSNSKDTKEAIKSINRLLVRDITGVDI